MADLAEIAILLQLFPDFQGKEGEEREWHSLARVVFEKHVPDWPVEEIRLFKKLVPKMVRTGGPTTQNRYHHKLIVSFNNHPSWALACCIKIMFGGWDVLKNSAIGKRIAKAFPGHDCGSWDCPQTHGPGSTKESETGSSKEATTKRRGAGAKRRQEATAQGKAGGCKRLKANSAPANTDDSMSPEQTGDGTKALEFSQRFEPDVSGFSTPGNAFGSDEHTNIVKAEPRATTQPNLPIFARTTPMEVTKTPVQQWADPMGHREATHSAFAEQGTTQTGEADERAPTTEPLRPDSARPSDTKAERLNESTISPHVRPSIEGFQVATDSGTRKYALFSRIYEELQRLKAVNQLQLLTHDGYVAHVAKLQEERILKLNGYIEELDGLE